MAVEVARALAGCALLLALSSASTAIAAGDSGLALDWRAARGCPDKAWALRSLDSLLRGADGAGSASTAFSVVLEPAPNGRFRARIVTQGDTGGERRFEGATCHAIAQAAVLIVAIAIDPTGVAERVQHAERRPPPPETDLGMTLAIGGDVGSLPAPTLGAGAILSWRYRRLSVGASAVAFLPRVAERGPRPGTGGEIGLYAGSLGACFHPLAPFGGVVHFGGCARVEVGLSTGRGVELRNPESSTAAWSAGFFGLSIFQMSAPLRPALTLEVGAPFVRPTYFIEGYGTVFRASPVLARAAVGVAWIFP